MCQPYNDNPIQQNAAVVCQELGYKGAFTTRRRSRNINIQSHVMWIGLHCSANEDTILIVSSVRVHFMKMYIRYPWTNILCQSKSSYEWFQLRVSTNQKVINFDAECIHVVIPSHSHHLMHRNMN